MVGEVATDTFYEYQLRDPGGQFHEVVGNDRNNSTHAWATTTGPHRKEDIQLPLEGDWQWVGNWEVSREPSCDSEGWMYRPGGTTGAADPSSSSHTWTSKVSPECLWRRRCWERKRRRSAVNVGTLRRQSIDKGHLLSPGNPAESNSCAREGQCEGMVLLTSLLCTLLRTARFQDSKLKCLTLLGHTSALCDDDTRLQRVVPFLLSMVGDQCAMVRAGAVEALTIVLASVEHLPPRCAFSHLPCEHAQEKCPGSFAASSIALSVVLVCLHILKFGHAHHLPLQRCKDISRVCVSGAFNAP